MSSNTKEEEDSRIEELQTTVDTEDTIEQALSDCKELQSGLEQVLDETESRLEELEDEQIASVQSSFERTIQEKWIDLERGTKDYAPGSFDSDVRHIMKEFRSILRHPEAEAAVEDLEEWIVNIGGRAFDEEERQSLVSVVERDIDAVKEGIRVGQDATSNIVPHLDSEQTKFVNLLRSEITGTETATGVRSTGNDLKSLQNEWPYPWSLELSDKVGDHIESRVNKILIGKMENILKADSFSEVITLVEERFGDAGETLETVEDQADRLVDDLEPLDTASVGNPRSVAQNLLDTKLSEATNLSSVESAVSRVRDQVDILRNLQVANLSQFTISREHITEELADSIEELESAHSKAEQVRRDVFNGDYDEALSEAKEEFTTAVQTAEDAISQMRSTTDQKIEASTVLAENFDIDEAKGALNELGMQLSRTDNADDILSLFEEHQTIRSEIRDAIREELSEQEEQLIEWIIQEEGEISIDSETLLNKAETMDTSRGKLIEALISLHEENLISLEIRGV